MVNEVIRFGDAEAMAVSWLTGKLAGVDVATKVPNPRPDLFVKVSRTGGARRDLAYREARLTFECWALNETDASGLAELGYAHMCAAQAETINGAFVRKVTTTGVPVYFEDPVAQRPRYQFTVAIQYRGAPLMEEES